MRKIAFALLLVTAAFIGINATLVEKDPLHLKVFALNHIEFKDGAPKPAAKPKPDEFTFKNGKVYSQFADEQLKFSSYIKYNIKKDSVYTEGDEERHYFEIEASSTDDDSQTLSIIIKIDDIDIEGSMKLTKADKLKKHFEFTGKEKPKKKK
jgi:hypothetical protein